MFSSIYRPIDFKTNLPTFSSLGLFFPFTLGSLLIELWSFTLQICQHPTPLSFTIFISVANTMHCHAPTTNITTPIYNCIHAVLRRNYSFCCFILTFLYRTRMGTVRILPDVLIPAYPRNALAECVRSSRLVTSHLQASRMLKFNSRRKVSFY